MFLKLKYTRVVNEKKSPEQANFLKFISKAQNEQYSFRQF